MTFKKKTFFALLLVLTICFSSTIFAATYAFTYNFKHQLATSKKKATQSSADFSCTTTSNGGDDEYFTIEQYKYKALGTNTYITSSTIDCTEGTTDTCSISTTKGTSYVYEFWKPTAVGYVVGSGTLDY